MRSGGSSVRLIALLVILFACGGWGPHGTPGAARTVVNITTAPYNAACNGDGVTNDIDAFVAFKNNYQGTTPVTLYIPSGRNCQIGPNSDQILLFKGVRDLIVSFYGATITNLGGTQPLLFGGTGEIQDNRHSARTNTVSAGSSCVVLKTPSQVNISNISNASGRFRITVSSTSGMSSGDTVFIANVTADTGMLNEVLGNQWIEVIDGTHFDIMTKSFNGAYTSGGIVGGDLTYLFTVGQYSLMTGLALQIYWDTPNGYGFPSNQHYFEYVRVASKNSGTQQVCFTSALANSYKATWPTLNTGWAFEVDPGGPATLYALDSSWDAVYEFQGGRIINPNFQITSKGRSVTWRDITWEGSNCAAPSENVLWRAVGASGISCDIETDKLIGTLSYESSTMYKITVQSSSIDLLNMSNTTFTNSIQGFPKRFTGTNVTTPLFAPGTKAYGRADTFNCTGCAFTTVVTSGFLEQALDNNSHTLCSMSGGVITCPNSLSTGSAEYIGRVLVPGTNVFWQGSEAAEGLFQVTDITNTITNMIITTSAAGGFPSVPYHGSGELRAMPHPAPSITSSSGSGDPIVLDWNAAPVGTPLFAYSNRTYTPNNLSGGVGPGGLVTQWGPIDTLTFSVPTPFTGTGGGVNFNLSQFNNWPILTNAGSFTNYGPIIDTTNGATRIITQSGVTGGQAGDGGLAVPDATLTYFPGPSNVGPTLSRDVHTQGAGPSINVILKTNQGVVLP